MLILFPRNLQIIVNKPFMKVSKVETIEAARKEYKKLFEEGWEKTSI